MRGILPCLKNPLIREAKMVQNKSLSDQLREKINPPYLVWYKIPVVGHANGLRTRLVQERCYALSEALQKLDKRPSNSTTWGIIETPIQARR